MSFVSLIPKAIIRILKRESGAPVSRRSWFLALVLGISSMTGQIILLREFITVFYGNETVYAIILGAWLFWVATGSFALSRLSPRIKNAARWLSVFLFLVALALPITVFAVRCTGRWLGTSPGEIVGVLAMSGPTLLVLAPIGILFGGIFSLACRYAADDSRKESPAQSVGSIYLWEAVGAAVGGVAVSLFLIRFVPAMAIAIIVGFLNAVAIVISLRGCPMSRRLGWGLIGILTAMALTGQINRLDRLSRQMQWQGFDIQKITDSIYGNITLTKTDEEYSLYESGLLSYSTKDQLASEEKIHFALLSHPAPRRVLLIGSALDGSLHEILKHPVEHVEVIELDPAVIAVSKEFLPQEILAPLSDPRVRLRYLDARFFVKQKKGRYDVIFISLPDPYNALLNRYYSLEFFEEAARVLTPGGILSLTVSSSENFLSKEAKDFLRSIHSTLKQVFVSVLPIPGDTNIFLATNQDGELNYDYHVLLQRLKDRAITTSYMSEYYLPAKLSADRLAYIQDVLKTKGQINSDMHPVAYFYDIVLWSTQFDSRFSHLCSNLQGLKLKHLLAVPVLLLIGGWLIKRQRPTTPVELSIFTTGASGIVFQIIVILAFQTLYGYAYYQLGFIMASFMAGLVAGSLLSKKVMRYDFSRQLLIYKITQAAICLYPLLLPFIFKQFRDLFIDNSLLGLFAGCFAFLPIIAGFIGGLQYPLAVSLIHQKVLGSVAKPAGGLYAFDVLGATVGALVTGSLLIPLLGIADLAYFFALVNLAVFMLLVGEKGRA